MPDLNAEEFDLQVLLDKCPDFAGFTKHGTHRETPDFLITRGHEVIGVEHTKVFHRGGSGSRQALESMEDRILSLAKAMYASHDLPPLDVTIVFYPGMVVPKPEMPRHAKFIADSLARSIGKVAPVAMQRVEVCRGGDSMDDDVDDGYPVISLLAYTVMPSADYGRWKVARAGGIMPNMIEQVYSSIREKDDLVPAYHKVCPRSILLIVGGHNPSSFFKYDSGTLGFTYPTRFDSVYLMHRYEAEVKCLKTRRYEEMIDHDRLRADVDARLASFEAMGRGLLMTDEAYADLKAKVIEVGPDAVARFQAMGGSV